MKWVLVEADAGAEARLSSQAGLHPLIARLMVGRGITEPAAVSAFLSCDLSALSAPGIFLHMEKAVGRIRAAVSQREKIVIYGDYDVDGVTGSAILFRALTDLGAQVECYIPDRMSEGYGLNAEAVRKIKSSGGGLVITVDCGISALREAELARSIGLELIITDHHESAAVHPGHDGTPGNALLPDAYAILHPSILSPSIPAGTREGVAGLTGAGVAFKLAQALMDARPDDERLRPLLPLATLGTVADVGAITGENRVLVKHGLEILSSDSPELGHGIRALKEVSGIAGKPVTVGTVGFTLAPRINASGRLESAEMAFRLFTTGSREEALTLAGALDTVNRERRSIEEDIREDARKRCRQTDLDAAGALVLSSDEWHPGVIGIVASRIAEEFYRPTALISVKDGLGKGSGRSIPGFDLYEGLSACADLLTGFGGHKYAAGFSIAEDKIPELRRRLSAVALERMAASGFVRTLSIDSAIAFEDLTFDLMRELEKLAPFGQGNPEPRLGAKGLEVLSSRIVGNNHLKFRVKQGQGGAFGAIAFNRGDLHGKQVREGARLAAVFTPKLNTWNGRTDIELDIKDVKIEK